MKNPDKPKSSKVLTVIGIVLCVILVPLLVANCIMIVRSYTDTKNAPSVFSYTPMIVLSESMEPTIMGGDLIISHNAQPEEIVVGDVISFFDPASSTSAIVTHRVNDIIHNDDGTVSFETLGDNNLGIIDSELCPGENLIGIYKVRIPYLGSVAMFMQTTPGLLICVLVPIALFVAIDLIRRRKYDKKKRADTAQMMAELEALRAGAAAQQPEQTSAPETSVDDIVSQYRSDDKE